MKSKFIKISIFLSFLFLFVTFVNNYLAIKLWDYDFWWHLSTGRYIVENKVITDKDPFSFVNNLEENKYINPVRAKFILKQYWLSQVIFYKIYETFGEKGIIILRSFILFAIIFIVFWWFKRQKVSFYIIYPFVFFVFLHTMVFTGERPVLFTMLFAVILLCILEEFKKRKSGLIFSVIPIMLLWSNMHGGFILGVVIILTYIFGETISFLLKRGEIDKRALTTLYIAGFSAIAVSAINPNGFNAFLTFTSQNKLFERGIQEYASPFTAYQMKVRSIDWEYIALLLLFPVLIILRNKKIDIVYFILLFGLMYMSISALRFVIYYVCISAMVLGRELHYVIEDYFKRFKKNKYRFELIATIMIFVSSILFITGTLNFNRVTFAKATGFSVPEGATDYIESNSIEGNLYNTMGFGGYLTWRLYPWKKVFIDTRSLNLTVNNEYSWILRAVSSIKNPVLPEGKIPLWERLIDHYRIDVIVLNTLDIHGSVPPLIFRLVENDKWVPVYADLISVVFVREKEENKEFIDEHRLQDDDVYNSLIVRATEWAKRHRKNPRYMLSLGEVFFYMGKYDDALKAYEYADKRQPSGLIKFKIEQIKKEIESTT